MQKKYFIVTGMLILSLLTGCQSNSNHTNTDDVQTDNNSGQSAAEPTENSAVQYTTQPGQTDNSAVQDSAQPGQTDNTTYTVEDLTDMIKQFEKKAEEAENSDRRNDTSLRSLKQESEQIEQYLDEKEDALEKQYRDGSLSKDSYQKRDWELEQLEERLDSAEDQLEANFGIDD